jgi:TIR domain
MAMMIDRSVEARARRRPHLFLSHSSKDKEWVHALARDLSVCEIDVWLDEWELVVGDKLAAGQARATRRLTAAERRHFGLKPEGP